MGTPVCVTVLVDADVRTDVELVAVDTEVLALVEVTLNGLTDEDVADNVVADEISDVVVLTKTPVVEDGSEALGPVPRGADVGAEDGAVDDVLLGTPVVER